MLRRGICQRICGFALSRKDIWSTHVYDCASLRRCCRRSHARRPASPIATHRALANDLIAGLLECRRREVIRHQNLQGFGGAVSLASSRVYRPPERFFTSPWICPKIAYENDTSQKLLKGVGMEEMERREELQEE